MTPLQTTRGTSSLSLPLPLSLPLSLSLPLPLPLMLLLLLLVARVSSPRAAHPAPPGCDSTGRPRHLTRRR